MTSFSIVSNSPEETAQVARSIATHLRAGDIVLLSGELASGKTTFVKAVAAALGSHDTVTSPTFTLAQFYATGRAPVLHIDVYRIDDIAEYRDLGIDDYVEDSVTLVEWGDRVASEFGCHLSIHLARDTDQTERRTITISSSCDRWAPALAELRDTAMAVVR